MPPTESSGTPFRLSPQQSRLWDLGEVGLPPRARLRLRLPAEVPTGRVAARWSRAVAQHPVLRTRFHRRPGIRRPLQVVEPAVRPGFAAVDLTALPEDRGEAELDRVAAAATPREGFAAAQERPGRAVLMRLPGSAALLVDLPALAADARSLELLADLLAADAGAATQQPGDYVQFSEWQNHVAGEEQEPDGADHWRRTAAVTEELPLPWRRSAPEARWRSREVEVGRWSRRRLETPGVPVPALLAAALFALGHHLGRSREMRLWWLADGRSFPEIRGLLGPVDRPLPLVVDLAGEEPFADLASRTAREMEAAERWQDDLAWDDAVPAPGACAVERRPRPAVVEGTSAPAVRCALRLVARPATDGDDTVVVLEHDPDQLSPAAAQRRARQLHDVLAAVLEAPQTPLARLPLATAPTAAPEVAPDAPSPTFVERFARRAARRPQAVAVAQEGRALTYAELDRRSRRAARWLRQRGAGPETVVALALERRPEALVWMLAALRAGAAFWFLEPDVPRPRLEAMLEGLRGAAPPCLLLWEGREESFAGLPVPTLPAAQAEAGARNAGEGGEDDAAADDSAPGAPRPLTRSLAYVVFTSGSTGTPKPVGVEHRHLGSYVGGILERLGLAEDGGEGPVFGLLSTLAADLGYTSVFAALASGGRLEMVPVACTTNPVACAEYLARWPLDVVKVVPTHLSALLSAPRPQRLLPSRWLVLGGEALRWRLVDGVTRLLDGGAGNGGPGPAVVNHYGPTETTVGVLAGALPGLPFRLPEAASAPLGRPLGTARIYLLDRGLEPVPEGVPGEICVGGGSVARGYLGRPAATAAAFLPDPWSAEPGGRLYRTGDRARRLPDGGTEFLGRVDHQVKVRGHRVEPAEVEAALAEHPAVVAAAVVLRGEPGEERLIGYWQDGGEGDDGLPGVEELRRFLLQRLPEPMVPTVLVHLDELPRNANGKVDRSALDAPVGDRPDLDVPYAPPRDGVEELLVELWQEVLGVDRVGIHDRFFTLGGDSIRSVRVVGLALEQGLELTVQDLFRHQTVAELAAHLAASATDGAGDDAELAGLLDEIEGLSEDEVRRQLETTRSGGAG